MAKSDTQDSSSEEEYEVECIRSKRIKQGKTEYHIKWKGYPESQNSWEPVDNLDCPELIAKYEKEQEEKKKKDEVKKQKETESKKKDTDVKKKDSEPKKKDDSKKVEPKKEDSKKKDKNPVKKEPENKSDSIKKKRSNGDATSNSNSSKKTKCDSDEESKPVGFARGLKPAKIMGATEVDGQLKFLMAWDGTDNTEMVLAKEANVKCPQLVIDFYEERLTWHNIEKN